MKAIDITGQRFWRLVALRQDFNGKWKNARWVFKCDCGVEKSILGITVRKGLTRSCGCFRNEVAASRKENKNPNWRGGKSLTHSGYVVTKSKGRCRLEHRQVMEEFLGRELFPGETVHHRNGIKTDNSISNLELRASNHGPGQSVDDLVVWAVSLLKRYAPESLR